MKQIIKETIQQFIVGGIIIAITSYLAVHVNPTIAAIFWSFPLSLLPVIIFMWIKNSPRKSIADYALSTAISLINLGLFVVVFGYMTKYNDYSIMVNLLMATVAWIIGSLLLYIFYLRK